FLLDALAATDAIRLQERLLRSSPRAAATPGHESNRTPHGSHALAPLSWRRVPYNSLSMPGFLTALGLLWGAHWFLTMFGFDLQSWAWDLLDPGGRGWLGAITIAVVFVGVIGVLGMAASFITGFWKFELARTTGPGGSQ